MRCARPRRPYRQRRRWPLLRVLASLAIAVGVLIAAARPARAQEREQEQERERLAEAARSSDAAVASDALYELAVLDDGELHFAAAAAEYAACAVRLPSSRWAPRANLRAHALETHAEGDFAPLVRLERVRRDPALASDPATIDALARDALGFPPGPVRVEAEMLVAEAYRGRLGRPKDAVDELQRIVADPSADILTARQAGRELIEALVLMGEVDEAAQVAKVHAARLDGKVVVHVRRILRRRLAHRAAWGAIALLALLVLGSVGLAWRRGRIALVAQALRKILPLALAFAGYSAIAGAILASTYETGNAAPFLGMGAATFLLVVVARGWSAAGSNGTAARVGRALLCAASVAAAAFLVLEHIDTLYLEAFGL